MINSSYVDIRKLLYSDSSPGKRTLDWEEGPFFPVSRFVYSKSFHFNITCRLVHSQVAR